MGSGSKKGNARWWALGVGVSVAGGACGALAHWIVKQAAWAPHAATGAVVGAVVVLGGFLWRQHRLRLEWKKVTVTVPFLGKVEGEVSDAREDFAVSPAQRDIGWRIYVQLVTRVSTQPVREGMGTLHGSLSSLYALMQTIREDLRSLPPTAPREGENVHTIETLAAWIMNVIRNVLAEHHQPLADYEQLHQSEQGYPKAAECWKDLEETRGRLNSYAVALSELLEVQPPEAFQSPRRIS